MKRREFIAKTGSAAAAAVFAAPLESQTGTGAAKKMRLAMVGTGSRGTGMWGRSVVSEYGELVEFVGLCDINPGRVETAKNAMQVACPIYTDFDRMIKEIRPDKLIVTTVDATHHSFIVKGLQAGCDVVTEKPMTTDEVKCQAILDAEKKTGRKVTVTFNYRYSPHRQKMKELLMAGRIGKLTSVDFHWYLDIIHGADYFRRWHRLREKSGTLLVHKASHHFDLLNWWIDSDPEEVYASGALDFYGRNHEFRATNCRSCTYKDKCKFYWDITRSREYMSLYVANEKHDGYLRDGCVWKEDINIFDKMAATIKYANKVQVSYSLTTYSPYEGYRIAFNGTTGRMDAWIQERQPWPRENYDEIWVTDNFGKREIIKVSETGAGHGGGDTRLKDKIFKDPTMDDPLKMAAGTRDGAFSCLVGIAARKSIDTGKPVKIASLTTLVPQPNRG